MLPLPFKAAWVQQALLDQRLPYAVQYKPVTDSTNDDALGAAHGAAHHRTVFISDEQTRGRGREGRKWHSEPETGLTFSVLLRPGWEARQTTGFALAVGLAVRDALAKWTPTEPTIKWPNDVLVNDRKIAGTLVETQIRGNKVASLVVGIGINVNTTTLPQEVESTATSLKILSGRSIEREAVLIELLKQLDARYRDFSEHGLATSLADLKKFDALLDQPIEVGHSVGTGAGISREGALRLRLASGGEQLIQSGTVRSLAPR